ncbi:hypothetical protein ACWJXL_17535 [Clostridioides difficile]|uniref:hypothetical protein n=1 Tax=Clostridioides difficile TaxID=1496 RepID=UPI0005DAB391|nr:hypothetical protein [Clostridioides difficile]KJF64364.1 hypothetical protein TZ54_06635 [Clostridioides difficile]MDB2780777.1 hypothetical protein [Clostridioides difficile]MDV9234103.1 hypothetical protein [Clostridioides difficile]HBG7072578.1 hypothetical protein [Clostridioides difficile]HBG7268448.1 hypothetical protein [Clostridioides difficile]
MKLIRKFIYIFTFIISVSFLSACSTQSKDSVELVKHYGQDKVDEMKVKCTDEKQLEVANSLVKKAKQIMSYTGSKEKADINNCGALKKYYFFNQGSYQDAKSAEIKIELITTKQKKGKGYIWIKYSSSYYDQNNQIIVASTDVISRWSIAMKNGEWTVTDINEMS